MADSAAALREVLLAADVAGGRVDAGSLHSADGMPTDTVLLRAAGGGVLAAGWMPTVDARVDVRSYAATDWEATQLDRQVARLLNGLRHEHTGHGRILWCRFAGGPTQAREPDTDWPLVLSTWQVYGDWLAE